jgi:hypothetical protein
MEVNEDAYSVGVGNSPFVVVGGIREGIVRPA